MNSCEVDKFERVIEADVCIGCGGCATVEKNIEMKFDSRGLLQPKGSVRDSTRVSNVCPFATSRNEDAIGAALFGSEGVSHDVRIGYYRSVYVGHVAEEAFRSRGSSGGFVTWILTELLNRGLIDGVIHVKSSIEEGVIFEYGVSTTIDEIIDGAKSKYYPVHFDKVIKKIKGNGRRYAFVGVPCFVKSIRLICEKDEVLKSQISYCIALFCGHMKSANYSQFISGQVGILPHELRSIDFRVKNPSAPANRYGFSVEYSRNGAMLRRSLSNSKLYGVDWGLGYFKPKACDWCDDIVGELADVSSGDAWLPGYVSDPGGNNVVIVREKVIDEIIREGQKSTVLRLDVKTPNEVQESQEGNYRHRREGLLVRMENAERKGTWYPEKRIFCDVSNISIRRRNLYLHREYISRLSHDVFLASDKKPLLFAMRMSIPEIKYYWLSSRLVRGLAKLSIQFCRLTARMAIYWVYK